MDEREKVIKGIRCHTAISCLCEECPYKDYGTDDFCNTECYEAILYDALDVLEKE